MMNRWKPLFMAALAVAASTPTLVVSGQAMAAGKVPFTDPSSIGSITFCGRNDEPVTSGSLLQEPFVWKAVSSSSAPKGYTRAYLALYQPIQHVDPSDWSGYEMTDDAVFTNPGHPAAQSTNIDAALVGPDHQYPPYWNGLYQLRMFYTSPDKPPFTLTYPTAVIKVSGGNWSLVSGGGTACSAGNAVSEASKIIAPSLLKTPQTIIVGPKTPNSGETSRTKAESASSAAKSSANAAASTTSTPGNISRSSSTTISHAEALGTSQRVGRGHSGGGSATPLIGGIVAAILVVGGILGGFVYRRRGMSR